jgi:uncharacterized surface protein with fasciclin (FAS1) repeats
MKLVSMLALVTALVLTTPAARANDTTLAQALAADPQLSTLNAAIEAAGLGAALAAAPEITVLAPTNDAFAALPAGTVEGLLAPERKADLEKLLQGHALGAAYTSNDLKTRRSITTLAGTAVKPTLVRGKLRLNDEVRVAGKAIRIANGYVIVIDQVLLP